MSAWRPWRKTHHSGQQLAGVRCTWGLGKQEERCAEDTATYERQYTQEAVGPRAPAKSAGAPRRDCIQGPSQKSSSQDPARSPGTGKLLSRSALKSCCCGTAAGNGWLGTSAQPQCTEYSARAMLGCHPVSQHTAGSALHTNKYPLSCKGHTEQSARHMLPLH